MACSLGNHSFHCPQRSRELLIGDYGGSYLVPMYSEYSRPACVGRDIALMDGMTQANAVQKIMAMQGGMNGRCASCLIAHSAAGQKAAAAACATGWWQRGTKVPAAGTKTADGGTLSMRDKKKKTLSHFAKAADEVERRLLKRQHARVQRALRTRKQKWDHLIHQ